MLEKHVYQWLSFSHISPQEFPIFKPLCFFLKFFTTIISHLNIIIVKHFHTEPTSINILCHNINTFLNGVLVKTLSSNNFRLHLHRHNYIYPQNSIFPQEFRVEGSGQPGHHQHVSLLQPDKFRYEAGTNR